MGMSSFQKRWSNEYALYIEETDFLIEGRLFFYLANYEKKEQNKKVLVYTWANENFHTEAFEVSELKVCKI